MELTFCWHRLAEWSMRPADYRRSRLRLQMDQQKPCWQVPAGSVSRPQARAGLWLSCCLWPDLTSRTRGRGALGGRGSLRQRGSAVDGFDDVIGGEVMDHVAEPRKNGQLALGDLLVQTLRLAI